MGYCRFRKYTQELHKNTEFLTEIPSQILRVYCLWTQTKMESQPLVTAGFEMMETLPNGFPLTTAPWRHGEMPSPNSHSLEFSHTKCDHTNPTQLSHVRTTRKSPWKPLEPLNYTRGTRCQRQKATSPLHCSHPDTERNPSPWHLALCWEQQILRLRAPLEPTRPGLNLCAQPGGVHRIPSFVSCLTSRKRLGWAHQLWNPALILTNLCSQLQHSREEAAVHLF